MLHPRLVVCPHCIVYGLSQSDSGLVFSSCVLLLLFVFLQSNQGASYTIPQLPATNPPWSVVAELSNDGPHSDCTLSLGCGSYQPVVGMAIPPGGRYLYQFDSLQNCDLYFYVQNRDVLHYAHCSVFVYPGSPNMPCPVNGGSYDAM
jgi:hypothetical protein